MANVNLTWTLPTVTSRQRPIAHVKIDARVQGESAWSEINRVTPDQTSLLVEQLAPGTWEFRGTVVDVDDQTSPSPRAAVAVIGFDPPSDLVEFDATLA